MVLMNGGIKDMAKNKQNDALFLKAEKLLEEGFEEKAFKCYKKCAKQGNYNCQHNLAYFYDKGIGVEENPTKAIFWYKKSYSNNPILPSANNLALIYLEQGKYLKALKWFIRAIECHKKQNKKQK